MKKSLKILGILLTLCAIYSEAYAAAPTVVQVIPGNYNTNSSLTSVATSSSIHITINDDLSVCGFTEDSGIAGLMSISGQGANGLTWTKRQQFNTTSNVGAVMYTATATSTGQTIVAMNRANTNATHNSFDFFEFSNDGGFGNTSGSTNTTGAPTVNLTTTAADSLVIGCIGDWSAAAGASTWRTGFGSFTKSTDYDGSTVGDYSIHEGYHPDATTASTQAVGVTIPASEKYTIMALEIKAAASTGPAAKVVGKLWAWANLWANGNLRIY